MDISWTANLRLMLCYMRQEQQAGRLVTSNFFGMQQTWFPFELLRLKRAVKLVKGFLACGSKIVRIIIITLHLLTFTTWIQFYHQSSLEENNHKKMVNSAWTIHEKRW